MSCFSEEEMDRRFPVHRAIVVVDVRGSAIRAVPISTRSRSVTGSTAPRRTRSAAPGSHGIVAITRTAAMAYSS